MVTVKPVEDMKKPLSKVIEDPEHYRTMFSGPVVYSEDLKHINPKEVKDNDWEKKGVVSKLDNVLANYQPSATAIAMATAERERVAKHNAEEVFDEVFSLKQSKRIILFRF